MKIFNWSTAGIAGLGVALFLASAAAGHALETVSVRLKWVPQAQFAGFYVAKEKGFYEEAGLDVTINPGGPNLNGETLVATGADNFALAGSVESLLSSSDKGLPIVGVGMLLQHTPSAYVAHADSGITSPADFRGKTVSTFFTGAQNMLFAVLAAAGVDEKDVNVVPQAVSMAPFIDRQVDVATVMLYNELNVLRKQGLNDLVVLHPEDYGVSFPSDPIITNQTMIAEKPEVVQAFVNATLRGWAYAIANQQEAVDIVMAVAPGLESEHQSAMLKAYAELMLAGNGRKSGIGLLDMDALEKAREMLIQRNAVNPDIQLTDVVDNRFWEAAPADAKIVP
ncbi:MAG: ABC transporter substrate-binding protein [Rhizobiaceae bacterium]|nr:ABC transporter substrate-binding protein [Rhizobiaceae bacterium]